MRRTAPLASVAVLIGSACTGGSASTPRSISPPTDASLLGGNPGRMRRCFRSAQVWKVATLLFICFMAACSSGGAASPSLVSTRGPTASSSLIPSAVPSVVLTQAELPKMLSPAEAGGVHIGASHEADWTLVAYGKTWVKGLDAGGLGLGVGVFDARSGRRIGSISVPQGPCAAMDAGFGAVWTATCGTRGVSRIDPRTIRVTGHVALAVPPDGESSIGAGEGGVWAISDGSQCSACQIAKIDPRTMKIVQRFSVPSDASAVRAGLGGVWVTYYLSDQVLRLDPSNGTVVATIHVALGPRFFDVGEGGVWVMAQLDGAVCHIDPKTNTVVACTQIDPLGVQGGDLTIGGGWVWFRGTAELVAQLDPRTGKVVARIGPGQGSGSASAGSGELWISAHDVASLFRIPLN